MRLSLCTAVCLFALGLSVSAQETQEIRMLNGTVVKGAVVSVKTEGMEIRAGDATRLYPWSALSHGTRYRYDPLYRSNFAFAQQGRPADQWTNAPDGEYSVKPADLVPPSPATAGDAESTILPLGGFPDFPARPLNSLVELDAEQRARTLAWGFRYGPEELDAAYFIFDPPGPDGLPPGGSLWTQPDKRLERVRGSRRAAGSDAVMNFRRQQFKGALAGVDAQYDLSFVAATLHPDTLFLSMDVELKKDRTSSSFTLLGTPPGLVYGDGEISARDLVVPPDLTLRIVSVEGKPTLFGHLRMGRLLLLPRGGMDKAVHVRVADARDQALVDTKVSVVEDSPSARESFTMPVEGLESGQRYLVYGSINLGPLLGVAQVETTYAAP